MNPVSIEHARAAAERPPRRRAATALTLMATIIGMIAWWAVGAASAQVTVPARDTVPPPDAERLFAKNATGTTVDVAGRLGTTGGPQAWDFREGPTDSEWLYRYLDITDDPFYIDYPGAETEELTLEDGIAQDSRVLRVRENVGAELLGYYAPVNSPGDPYVVLDQPIVEVPDPLVLGAEWSGTANFVNVLVLGGMVIPVNVTLTQEAVADAYGTVLLPGIGEVDALRVNQMVRFLSEVPGIGVIQDVYSRSFLWYAPRFGLVSMVTAASAEAIPPTDFTAADSVLRLTEAVGFWPGSGDPFIADATITFLEGAVLLSWDGGPEGTVFRVETLTDPETGWELLVETTETEIIDPFDEGGRRFYRILVVEAVGVGG